MRYSTVAKAEKSKSAVLAREQNLIFKAQHQWPG